MDGKRRRNLNDANSSLEAEGFWIDERNVIPREDGVGPVLDVTAATDGLFMCESGVARNSYKRPRPANQGSSGGSGNQGGKGKIAMGRGSKKMPAYLG